MAQMLWERSFACLWLLLVHLVFASRRRMHPARVVKGEDVRVEQGSRYVSDSAHTHAHWGAHLQAGWKGFYRKAPDGSATEGGCGLCQAAAAAARWLTTHCFQVQNTWGEGLYTYSIKTTDCQQSNLWVQSNYIPRTKKDLFCSQKSTKSFLVKKRCLFVSLKKLHHVHSTALSTVISIPCRLLSEWKHADTEKRTSSVTSIREVRRYATVETES